MRACWALERQARPGAGERLLPARAARQTRAASSLALAPEVGRRAPGAAAARAQAMQGRTTSARNWPRPVALAPGEQISDLVTLSRGQSVPAAGTGFASTHRPSRGRPFSL